MEVVIITTVEVQKRKRIKPQNFQIACEFVKSHTLPISYHLLTKKFIHFYYLYNDPYLTRYFRLIVCQIGQKNIINFY